MAKDACTLKKSSYRLQRCTLSPEEESVYLAMLRKHAIVYESIVAEDRKESLVLNGVDSSDVFAIVSYLHTEMSALGLYPLYLGLMQELLTFPIETVKGQQLWAALVGGCKYLRSLAALESSDGASSTSTLLLDEKTRDILCQIFGESNINLLLENKSPCSAAAVMSKSNRRMSDVSKFSVLLASKDAEIDKLKKMIGSNESSNIVANEDISCKSLPLVTDENDNTNNVAVDPKYAKYVRMKKILPEVAIRQKMKLEGVLSEEEINNFFHTSKDLSMDTQPRNSVVENKFEKFVRMKKMLPETAVRQKMKLEGVSDEDIQNFFNGGTSANQVESSTVNTSVNVNSAKFEKFLKMKLSMPEIAIRQKMVLQGFSSVEIEAFFKPDQQDPANSTVRNFEKYDRMKATMPVAAVRQRMIQDKIPLHDIDSYFGQENNYAHDENNVSSGLPKKKFLAPSKKVKGLFWTKISPKDIPGSIWHKNVPDFTLTATDRENLESWFGVVGNASGMDPMSPANPGARSSKAVEKVRAVSLLDSKRTQNVLIALGKLRHSPSQLVNILLQVQNYFPFHTYFTIYYYYEFILFFLLVGSWGSIT